MARHRAIDLLRKRRPETSLTWQDDDGQEHQHDVADDSGTPQDQLQGRQDDSRLSHCVGTLDEAVRARLITEIGGSPRQYQFAHAMIHAGIHQGRSRAEYGRWHWRIGEVLEGAAA